MWVRLDKKELDLVTSGLAQLSELGDRDEVTSLITRLHEKADPDPVDEHFRSAVETSDELEVDPDAVVSRGEDGAFVMSWSWVGNDAAGVETE